MPTDRVLKTIIFFSLQHVPLTSWEVYIYLLSDPSSWQRHVSNRYQLVDTDIDRTPVVSFDQVLRALDQLLVAGEVIFDQGFYALPSQANAPSVRIAGYIFGRRREKIINRWAWLLGLVPFIRAVGLNGSQALGKQSAHSDIDLFIMTDTSRMWTARLFVSGLLQILGVRRHGRFVANRFCLNHYLGRNKPLQEHRSLYTALEYGKMRPLVYGHYLSAFLKKNLLWMHVFFPHLTVAEDPKISGSKFQCFFEYLLSGSLGEWFDRTIKRMQWQRIRIDDEEVIVKADELSFHPDTKEIDLIETFLSKIAISTPTVVSVDVKIEVAEIITV